MKGLKDQVVGKVKRDPDQIQRGKEKASGELAQKEREEDLQEV